MNTAVLPSSAAGIVAEDGARTHALPDRRSTHAVSWAAIFAGATGAAVLSLVLMLLGSGVGLSTVSPWVDRGASAATVGLSAIIWMTVVQLLASLVGGYLAGRLRARWISMHDHELFFRDTAHGFLAWAVATLVTASLLSSAVGSVMSGGVKASAAIAGSAATIAGGGAAVATGNAGSSTNGSDPLSYFTDSMFRLPAGTGPGAAPGGAAMSQSAHAAGNAPPPTAEVGRIMAMSLKNGALAPADSQYVAQLVAQQTGMTPEEAQKRVSDTYAQAQQSIRDAKAQAQAAADIARKASAVLALWLVVSLMVGAFTASWAATFGGRLRDAVDAVSR